MFLHGFGSEQSTKSRTYGKKLFDGSKQAIRTHYLLLMKSLRVATAHQLSLFPIIAAKIYWSLFSLYPMTSLPLYRVRCTGILSVGNQRLLCQKSKPPSKSMVTESTAMSYLSSRNVSSARTNSQISVSRNGFPSSMDQSARTAFPRKSASPRPREC